MPIRLNLLAEEQAAEAARRRDPVKRVIWLAALAIVLILVWSSSLQLKAMLIRSDVNQLEAQISSHTNQYLVVLDNQNQAAEINRKLAALRKLSATRLLNGTLLNALQQTTVEDVNLLRLRLEQNYNYVAGTKARTNEHNALIPGKPASSTEKIVVTLEGTDGSANSGDGLNKYKEALAINPYFKEALVRTNGISLKSLAPPQVSPRDGKRSVTFTLECRYPECTR
ncbi:MAG TPA: hypothetical protein P5205_14225 [Candidatus Paceibacterota bacterium]|nr:hypothetical protein [Verrucomicrobiota bacterium]HSA11519.1 hypothetical protein [Candidatus Paceibacterota bacterium]